MNVDDVFAEIGELGLEQWKYIVLLSLLHLYYPVHMLKYTFTGREIPHACRLAENGAENSGPAKNSSATNGTTMTRYDYCPQEGETCQFDFGQEETSIATEWMLVCDRAWLRPMAMSSFMFGVMIGAVICGWISDTRGRRFTLFLTLVCMIITNQLGVMTTDFTMYCVTRWMDGFFCGGHVLAMSVLSNEVIGNSQRGKAAAVIGSTWALGLVAYSLMAYYNRHWRWLTTLITLMGLPLLPIYFLLPESPRWLVSQRRYQEANEVIRRIANGNGAPYKDEYVLRLETAKSGSGSGSGSDNNDPEPATEVVKSRALAHSAHNGPRMRDLFRHRSLALITLIQLYSWFVHSASYYGLTLVGGNESSDLYLATAFSGLVEVPATLLSTVLLTYYGRRRPLAGFMISCGLSQFVILLSSYLPGMAVSIALFGKLCISASFTIIYIHSSEIFPTSIRNTAMGLCAVTSRFGGVLSPYLAELGSVVPNLHFLLFGFLALSAGLLNLRLPETLGRPLPETIADLLRLIETEGRKGVPGPRGKLPSPGAKDGGVQYTKLSLDGTSEDEI